MRFLPVANPPNPFAATTLTYDLEEIPNATFQVFEDHSRTILATNDSPDVGFRWSVNPYRGCQHACAYCLSGDTPILMADGRAKELRNVRVGDRIYGTSKEGDYRRYVVATVLAHWQTLKPAYRVRLDDGTELITSEDHRFLSNRGWKFVTGSGHGASRRPFLTTGNHLLGLGRFATTNTEDRVSGEEGHAQYRQGYLCGMIRGDALLKIFHYDRPGRANGNQYQFRLALIDLDALRRTRQYLAELEIETSAEYVFAEASGARSRVTAIRTHAPANVARIQSVIEWPLHPTSEWSRGFLAGIFDAEGSYSCGVLRISNTDARMLKETERACRLFGFDTILEPPSRSAVASNVRIRGGTREHLRFFHLVDPAIRRKCTIEGRAVKHKNARTVVSVEKLGFDLLMYDITTSTGDFIADGVISHNCYARPTHEYLSLGAGTDFERKIVVKPNAPELLREAFDKKSWKGELIVFSGVTDCYQPLEASYELTRRCLQVCIEYKNPAGFITKSPVIERDIDLLVELARVASCRVSVSIPFWDPLVAKAMEPVVTTPARRMRIVETLAKAGITVGVSVSPIVPGLNDEDIAQVLTAAKNAGASHAFFVLLRLPGSVKDVFVAALQEKLPLRAEKVLRRLREAHGGKLYGSRWSSRQRGEGPYSDAIQTLFDTTAKRLGLLSESTAFASATTFQRPDRSGQTSFGF